MIAERKLRVLAKTDSNFAAARQQLRGVIAKYEDLRWNDAGTLNEERLKDSDAAEQLAEQERQFQEKRKQLIKNRLKQFKLTQQELGKILGHKSKTYMSELMNGLCPFTNRDLIIINRLLHIDLKYLIPVFVSRQDVTAIKKVIGELHNTQLSFSEEGFLFQ